MKTFASFFAAVSVASVALADTNTTLVSPTQRISNFVLGGMNSTVNATSPKATYATTPTISMAGSGFTMSDDHNGIQWSPSDFSSFFASLPPALADHHFDPQSLTDLQTFINGLNLDPALQSKLDTFVQNLQNGNLGNEDEIGSSGDDNDENAENDNDEQGENEDMDEDEGVTQVPEPSTVAMLIAGASLLGATFLRRRVR